MRGLNEIVNMNEKAAKEGDKAVLRDHPVNVTVDLATNAKKKLAVHPINNRPLRPAKTFHDFLKDG